MPADVRDDVEISRRRAEASALTFGRHAHTRARIDTGRDAHFHCLSFRQRAFAFAERTRRTTLAGAAAIGALLRESQTPTRTLHLARALARRTGRHRAARVARAMTARALLRTIDGDVGCQTGDGFFETERERHLDVRA